MIRSSVDQLVIAWNNNMAVTNNSLTGLNKREIIPGTGNLVNYPGLMNTQILEENIQMSLF